MLPILPKQRCSLQSSGRSPESEIQLNHSVGNPQSRATNRAQKAPTLLLTSLIDLQVAQPILSTATTTL
ncbi:MAG: hypothetical protein ACM37W_05000 [Actinomycetota bacterium]